MRMLNQIECGQVSGGFDWGAVPPKKDPPDTKPPKDQPPGAPKGRPRDEIQTEVDELQRIVGQIVEDRRQDEAEKRCLDEYRMQFRNVGAVVGMAVATELTVVGGVLGLLGGAGTGEMLGGWYGEAVCRQ